MKQSILIICIILFSLIWWGIWAFWVIQYFQLQPLSLEKSESLELNKKETEGAQQQLDLVSLENTINNTVKDIAPSVVSIIIKKDMVIYRSDPWGFFQTPSWTINRKIWGGSWFFVREDGTILTNKHVVGDSDAEYTVILNTGEEYDAEVIATDPINDLAIIKISDENREFVPLEIVNSSSDIEVWDFGIAVGNALAEFQNSVSLGIVSAKDRSIEAWWDTLSWLLQTDAAINPWNSWGPLINLEWKVIGINTAIASRSTGIGFAFTLTGDRIDYMLQSIEESWRIMRPFIGINYIENSPAVADELWLSVDYGVYIIDEEGSIVENSSADTSGLEPWDIIISVNNERISGRAKLWEIIQNSLPGDILRLEIVRKWGSKENIDLELWAY